MLFCHYSVATALIKLRYYVKIVSVPRKVPGDVQVYALVGFSCWDNLCCCAFHRVLCRNGKSYFTSLAFACLRCWNVSEVRKSENYVTSLPRARLNISVRWRGAWWISTETEGCDAPLALLFMSYFVKIHSNLIWGPNCCWTKEREGKWRVKQCFI